MSRGTQQPSLDALRYGRLSNTKFTQGTPGCFICSGEVVPTENDKTGFKVRIEALLAEPKKTAAICHLCTTYIEGGVPRANEIIRYGVCPHEEIITRISSSDVPSHEAGGYGEMVVYVTPKTARLLTNHAAVNLRKLRELRGEIKPRQTGKKRTMDGEIVEDGGTAAGDEPEPRLPQTRGKSAAPGTRGSGKGKAKTAEDDDGGVAVGNAAEAGVALS